MITAEQTQAIETALSTYWAGGEPDQTLPAAWFSAYLDLNCITEANLDLLIDRIYSSPFNAEYTLKHQTRLLAIELSAQELNELGARVAEQSISDPGWLSGVLQRAGVLTGQESQTAGSMHMLASLFNQAQIGQSALPDQGEMAVGANEVSAAVQSLRNLVSAAQKVWSGTATLNLEDCKLLGVTSQASPLSDGQLERLNGLLQVRRTDMAPHEQTFATFNALTRSVVALDKKLLGAPDGIDLSVSDFENLGIKGVTATNIAFINSQLGTLDADPMDTWETLQNLVDRQLADALSRIQTAIDQQQTAELTSGDLTVLGLQLPSTFSLEAFKALLATHRGLSNENAEQQASSIEHLQALVQVSHKITQLKDNDTSNDPRLNADDLDTLTSVAQLGWVMYDVQARDLFNDVLKNSAQRGAQMLVVGEIEQIASTVSDIHRLASGGRPRSPLTLDRLEFIGVLQQDGLLHGDIVLQGLITVMARTGSSGTGVDTLAELNAMATAYHHVIQRVVNPGHPYALEEADYRALGLGTINSTSKARLLNDLLIGKTLQEVDSIAKLQGVADLAHRVVAYANAAPVVLTQADLEVMGISGLSEARTAQLLARLKEAGNKGEMIDSLDKIRAMVDTTAPHLNISDVRLSDDTGQSATDFITRSANQIITARLNADLAPDEKLYGSVDNGLSWNDISSSVTGTVIQWAALLHNGPNTIRFKILDAAGNSSLSESVGYLLDTAAPSVSQVQLSADSGTSSTDKVTNAAAQTITATLSSSLNTDHQLFGSVDGGKTWVNITSSVNGTTLQWKVELLSGPNTIQFKVSDSAGNEAISGSTAYLFDTFAPSLTISDIAISADTGLSNTDFITNTEQQTITATLNTGLEAGGQLFGRVDETSEWQDITANVNGDTLTWTTILTQGSHNIQFKVLDAAGNESLVNSTVYTLDTSPNPLSISHVGLDADTGTSSTDRITNTAEQTITATLDAALEPGSRLYGRVNASAQWQDITAQVKGTTVAWATTLVDGDQNLQFKIKDAAGNESIATSAAYTLDTEAPSLNIHSVQFNADTGTSNSDLNTSVTEQTITATLASDLETGSRIYARVSDFAAWQDITAYINNSTISWNTALVDGNHNIQFKKLDAAGNESDLVSAAYSLDCAAPSHQVIRLDFSADTGSDQTDLITRTEEQTITATLNTGLEAGEQLFGRVDETSEWQDITANVNGDTLTWTTILTQGSHNIQFKVLDAAGNESLTNSTVYTLDTSPNPLSISHVGLDADTGTSSTDRITNTAEQTITATLDAALEPGSRLYGRVNASAQWQDITAQVKGTTVAWATALTTGTHHIEFKVEDAAGNESLAGTSAYTLDTGLPGINIMRFSADTGWSHTDRITQTAKQTITAQLSSNLAAGDKLYGRVDGESDWQDITSNVSHNTLTWSGVTLRSGTNSVQLKLQDVAGNETITIQGYSLDTTPPPLRTIHGIGLSTDSGWNDKDLITNVALQTITASLSSAMAADEVLMGSLDGGKTWDNITSKVNGTSITWDGVTLLDGVNNLLFKIEDKAGNQAPSLSAGAQYTLDTAAPTQTIATAPEFPDSVKSGTVRITNDLNQEDVIATLDKVLEPNEMIYGSTDNGATWTHLTYRLRHYYQGDDQKKIHWEKVALHEGDNKLLYKVVDAAGNEKIIGTYDYSLNLSAPNISDIKLSADTGSSSADFVTQTAAQTITATLDKVLTKGSKLEAKVSTSDAWIDITSKVNGNQIVWDGALLKSGENAVCFKVTDAYGNSREYLNTTYTLDTSAPAPTVDAKSVQIFNADGVFSTDRRTNTATQTVKGTLSGPLTSGDILYGSIDSGATWTDISGFVDGNNIAWTGVTLRNGDHQIVFKVTDKAGNSSTPAEGAQYTLISNVASVTDVKLSDDTGSSNSDRITNATAQNITATLNSDLASGQSIWGSVNNGSSWVDITHCVSGRRINWEGVNLLDGSNTIRFKQGTDINSAVPTGIAEYLVDKTSMTPKVTAVVFSDDSDTAGDLVTKTATQATITVTLSSTLEAKGRIFGSVNNGQHWTELSHLVKGNSISWKGAVLQEGANNLVFKTVDVAGNEANAGSYSYGLYTQIPSITGLKFSADNGFSDSDFFTNTTKQTITATLSKPLSAGAKLEVSGDTGGSYTDITQYVKGTDLRFDYELPKKDALYLWSLVFKVTDKAGNVFEIGATPYAVETATPSLTVSNVTLSEDTGPSTSDLITARAVQTITATLSDKLERSNSHNLLLGSLDSGQTWTDISDKVNGTKIVWTGATLHNGTHSIQFKVVDKGGAQGAVTGNTSYTLDAMPPSVRSIKDVSFSDDTGFSTSDLITKTSSQIIKATLSEKLGSTEKLWGSVNGGTTWTDITSKVKETAIQWDGVTLVSGAQAIQFKVTTPSGAESLSNSVHYSLITAPPTISSITLGSDTGQNTNDQITNTGKQTVYATLSRDIMPNEVVLGSVNGGKDWINVTQWVKGNTMEWAGAMLAEGNNSVVFKIDDLAGNTGTTNSIVCTLDTQAPGAPKLSVDNSGSVAVVTLSEHAKESVLTYKIDFTDETGASRTITTQKVNEVWSASSLPEGANLSASTGTLRLNKDLIMDGSNVAVTVFDLAGNSSTVSKVASADSEPRPGDSLIDLGEFGTLIAPVQVEGKWYYHWDISGDGVAGNNDARSMNWLAENFFNSKTAGLITDSNRTFTVNGVTVRLSTLGGGSANANTAGTAYSKPDGDPEYNSNRVYNDLTAIWDAFNGTFEGLPAGSKDGTVVIAPGTPTGWTGAYYWSSSILPGWDSHYQFSMHYGSAALILDKSDYGYFALEVLEQGNLTKTIDSKTVRLSNDTGSSAIDLITSVPQQTILANFKTDLSATDVLEASMDEGANWIRIPNNKISGSTLTWDKVTLSEGTHKILFRVTDEAGNKTLSPAINYTLDKTAPGVSAVTFSQDTGGSSSDRITSVAPQTVAVQFSEVLGVGSKVLGSVDGGITWSQVNGTATDTTIQWQTQLHGGSNRLIFKGEDAAGNAFTSTPFAYLLETSMPMASAVKLSADTGIANDLVTKVGAQTITATLSAALSSNQQLYGSTNGGNTWFDITSSVNKQTISWNTTLLSGANAIQFKVTDTSGSAVISGSTAYVLDVDRPTFNMSGIKLSTDTGPVEWQGPSQDFITSSSAQTVTATLGRALVAGEQLLGSVNGGSSWLDITDKVKDRVLSWDKVALLSGKNSLQFKIADSAFNESDIIRTDYLLDTVAPTQTVSGVTLRFDTGLSNTDKVTNIAKQIIDAELSAALDTNDLLYGSVDNGATWVDLTQIVYGQTIEWSESELLTGNSTIVFKVTDKAGNTSATKGLTGQTAYTVDLTTPTQTISNVKLSKDTGTNSSDGITWTAAQTISATLSAELTSSDRLFARLDKASSWTDITSSISNKTSIQWATNLNPGTHELEFKVIDIAGNEMITGQTQYTLNLPPTLSMNDNGSLAVFAANQPGKTYSYSYALDYTDENGVAQVITVSKNGSEWHTTGLPQTGAAVLSSSGTLRLDKDQILDGSKFTLKMLDSLGSAEVASGTAGTDTTSLNGNSIIGLGAYGQLIAPVQVKGRWYYYWDTNGNGLADDGDAKSMNWLESTFFGGSSTDSVVTDSNRTFTVSGVQLRLPSLLSPDTKLSGTRYNSTIDDKVVSSGSSDLQSVWDAFNGSSSDKNLAGTPIGWQKQLASGVNAIYASSSVLANDVHQYLILESGWTNLSKHDDSTSRFFALEVL